MPPDQKQVDALGCYLEQLAGFLYAEKLAAFERRVVELQALCDRYGAEVRSLRARVAAALAEPEPVSRDEALRRAVAALRR